jgi:glycogen operon protein
VDLAPALTREEARTQRPSAFLDAIRQDPVLAGVKLIAEPWDLGPGGYRLGGFPPGWAEWNDRYRNAVRRFWRGDAGLGAELRQRLIGSPDLYAPSGRQPYASINYVTAHDGFTLADLVSYETKHNEANGEANRDGAEENFSWHCGTEGPTDDAEILARRERQMRNLLATLLFSGGTPMLLAGDERGRTQHGNNNAYCQDSERSWIDWGRAAAHADLTEFVRRLLEIRRAHPVFRRRSFFQGRPIRGGGVKDILWLAPGGGEITDEAWNATHARCLGFYLAGEALNEVDRRGRPVRDENLLVLVNADHAAVEFTLPRFRERTEWVVILDTSVAQSMRTRARFAGGQAYPLQGRSFVLLQEQEPGS